MKNKYLLKVLLNMVLSVVLTWAVCAEGGEEEELSGFTLFEKLRAMKLEAQSAMVREDYVEAAKIYRRMAQYEKNRARSAAYLLRGADCLMQAKKGHRALEEYTNLLENYPLYVPYEHVVEQLRQLAEWFVVGDGTFLGIRDKDTGIKIYELIIREAPAVQVTLRDRLRLAELLVESGRGEEAVVVYQTLLRQETDNWDVRAQLALLLLKLSKSGDGDGTKLRSAVREANIVIQNKPNHPKIKELKKLCKDAEIEEANRLLTSGKFYLMPAHHRPTAARRYMHDLILKYPDSSAAKEARHLLKTDPSLRALEDEQKAKAAPAVVEKPSTPPAPQKTAPAVVTKPASAPVPPPAKPDVKAQEREKAKLEAERLKREKERKEQETKLEAEKARKAREQEAKLEAEKARKARQQEAERKEAELKAEKLRKAEEAERQKAAEKAAKLKAKREAEEAKLREKQEKERQKLEKDRQKRLEEERKEREKQEKKRQEQLRVEAEKNARLKSKQESAERERIEKARFKAEEQLRGKPREDTTVNEQRVNEQRVNEQRVNEQRVNGQRVNEQRVKMVVPDRKKAEESRKAEEETLRRNRERNSKYLMNDPKLLEEEQRRLKELMEKNNRRN